MTVVKKQSKSCTVLIDTLDGGMTRRPEIKTKDQS